MSALRTRPPTGRVPWPLILIEGAEKAGKSWACAELSASPRVGPTYWLDLGEGSADEYGAIPGARYQIVEHDGTFGAILAAVEAVKDLAAKTFANGEPPVVLVIDSMTAEWDLLKGVADQRARARHAAKVRAGKATPLADDAEPKISMDLWNDANARHRRIMTHLMTFPGIVAITARGKDVAALDGGGRPIEGSKEYKVDGQKNLAYDATVWIRVSRDHPPLVVGARSVHAGVKPGVDKPRPMPELSLERVVFEILRCQPSSAAVRDLVDPQVTAADLADPAPESAPVSPARPPTAQPDQPRTAPAAPSEHARTIAASIAASTDRAGLASAWSLIAPALSAGQITQDDAEQLRARWHARKDHIAAPTETQRRHMHVLWGRAGFANDRPGRLAFTSEIIGRDVASSNDIWAGEYDPIVARLTTYIEQETPPDDATPPAEPAAPQLDDRRHRRLHQLLGRAGIPEADTLTYLGEAVGRAITDTRHITDQECDQLLPILEATAAELRQGVGR